MRADQPAGYLVLIGNAQPSHRPTAPRLTLVQTDEEIYYFLEQLTPAAGFPIVVWYGDRVVFQLRPLNGKWLPLSVYDDISGNHFMNLFSRCY